MFNVLYYIILYMIMILTYLKASFTDLLITSEPTKERIAIHYLMQYNCKVETVSINSKQEESIIKFTIYLLILLRTNKI